MKKTKTGVVIASFKIVRGCECNALTTPKNKLNLAASYRI